ncbi:MAG: ABC transporter ATP-binding protein [Candidatus Atribacteria bacterium]|nr:ABC transporter ATP-binding protein [Candidatus Atribacteria bacterium]
MAEIELRKVVKKYGELTAVNDLTFKGKENELLVLLGSPGAGKSSTLKMIAGVESVTSGEVIMNGQVINRFDPSERDMAMAFETYALYPHLSVFENIAFPLRSPKRARQFSEEDIKKKVREVTEFLEIEMLLERKPKELSGGQRQRVSLARCLIRTPQLYLFDEPIAHLDAKLRHRLRRELKKWQQTKKITTIYTTTDYLEAFSMGDRIVILNRGVLLQIGKWEEIYNRPTHLTIGTIISDPHMNTFLGEVISVGDQISIKVKDIVFDITPEIQNQIKKSSIKEVILGIFPSKIQAVDRLENKNVIENNYVEGVVEFIESRGSRRIVFLKTPYSLTFTLQLPLERPIRIGEKIRCLFDKKDIQIFDKDTKKNIMLL